jgi:predicted transposase YdaD
MKTDKQLFQIFAAMPEWLFELTGLESPGACSLRSFTFKALQRDADGVIVPQDARQPLTVVEFQFQKDETIYTRIVIEMAALQEAHGQRPVQGIILFGQPGLDPRTPPWTQIVQGVVLQDVLAELRQRNPDHPLANVFEPLLEPNDATLETVAADHYRALKQCDLDDRRRELLLDVFLNWLEQRFQTKSKKEIEIMLLLTELPDIRDTQTGRDLIAIGKREGKLEGEAVGEKRGEKRGETRGIDRGLENAVVLCAKERFRSVPKDLEERLPKLPRRAKEQLLRLIARAESIDELENWLRKHPLK